METKVVKISIGEQIIEQDDVSFLWRDFQGKLVILIADCYRLRPRTVKC